MYNKLLYFTDYNKQNYPYSVKSYSSTETHKYTYTSYYLIIGLADTSLGALEVMWVGS